MSSCVESAVSCELWPQQRQQLASLLAAGRTNVILDTGCNSTRPGHTVLQGHNYMCTAPRDGPVRGNGWCCERQ